MKKIGKLFLALGMIAVFAGCKKPTDEIVELTKIEITTPADKLEYLVGEDLDTTGLEITATYSDETTKVVTGWTTSGYDKTKAGEQTVKITYTENEITVETSYTVTVKEVPKAELTKIEITTEPAKKEYFVGATKLDLAGLEVTATYTDGTTADVTDKVTTTGFDSSAAVESQTITVTYEEKTATFTVKINPVLLTGIAVTTQPTKKDYHIDDEIDLTGIVVTANYNDGSTKTLGATEYTVTGFDSTDYVKDQVITVTHNDKTDTFKINVVFSWFETPKQLPASTDGTYGTEGTYVLFGVWPQNVVPVADVETLGLETSTNKVTRGYMDFVKGNDGNYYVKCAENAYDSGYKYNKDNSDVGQGGTTSRWFKVMPIKWRVVDTAYVVDGINGNSTAKLLVAENILTANVPYYNYGSSSRTRTVGEKTGIYPNNYEFSQIRAYLNGLDYYYDTSDTDTTIINTYTNKGFLQTAFTTEAAAKIETTKVDNSKDSTTNYDTQNGTIEKATDYACDPTDDKIFLLSEYEVTKYSRSTEKYSSDGPGNSRIRVTTDFAKANNAYQDTTEGYGGYWWLRSPFYFYSNFAHHVYNDGCAYLVQYVNDTGDGVVPALAISF